MQKLRKSGNAVYALTYHLVVVVKYRKQVFTTDKLISDLKTAFDSIASDFDVDIIEQMCSVDHMHIIFRAKPTLDVTKFVNILKGHSSRAMRKLHKGFLKKTLWGDSFWGSSYFLATSGNVTEDIANQYVETQRREHE